MVCFFFAINTLFQVQSVGPGRVCTKYWLSAERTEPVRDDPIIVDWIVKSQTKEPAKILKGKYKTLHQRI